MSETEKKVRWNARNLDAQTVSDIAPWTWVVWRTTDRVYWGTGYRAGTRPPQSGDLLLQSPYADWYNLTWGLAPNQDMPKWRWMYRARPEVKGGVDKKVTLAVGKGFSILCKDDQEIEDYANQLLDHLNMREVLQKCYHDLIVYGQAYFEKVRTTEDDKQETEKEEMGSIESRVFSSVYKEHSYQPTYLDVEEPNEMTTRTKAYLADLKAMDEFLASNQEILETEVFAPKKGRFRAYMDRANAKAKVLYETARYQATKWRMAQEPMTGIAPVTWTDPSKTPLSDQVNKPFGEQNLGLLQRRRKGGGTQTEDLRDEQFQTPEGELVELKGIDPLWMRINRDAFGNVIGFVQWGLTPIPQAIVTENIVFMRWMPKTWAQEDAYGTSQLMPIQRHVSMLVQAEEDMKVFWHQYAKPTAVIYAGTPERPYPVPALAGLVTKLQGRQPNTDMVLPGDTKLEVVKGQTQETANTFKEWSGYLREKIYEALGIPDVLMNLPGEMTRATSDVTLQAFVAEEMMGQQFLGEQFMKQVIEPEVRRHFTQKYPDGIIPPLKAIWPSILEEDRNKRIDRLTKSTGVAFETINEARNEAGLPPLDGDEYDTLQMIPMPVGGQTAPSKNPEISESTRTGDREESLSKIDTSVNER